MARILEYQENLFIQPYKEQENKLKLNRLSLHIQTAALLAVIMTLVISGCKPEGTAQAVDHLPEKTPVIVKSVTRISANRTISVSGALVADKTTHLGFLVPGKIDRVFADEGDMVPKGFLLATIESQDYQSRLDMAKAAELRARDAYERYEPLYREGAFSEKKLY